MFNACRDAAFTMAGDRPCLASTGYNLEYLWDQYNGLIQLKMRDDPKFLTKLMYKLDSVQQLFVDKLYRQIRHVGSGYFSLSQVLIDRRQDDLEDVFDRIERQEVSHFTIPAELARKFVVPKDPVGEDTSVSPPAALSPLKETKTSTSAATLLNRKQKLGNL